MAGLSGVAKIAVGADHSFALLPDGSARAWGYNGTGPLGDGTGTQRLTPVVVKLSDIKGIVGGWTSSMAVTASGSGYAWAATPTEGSVTARPARVRRRSTRSTT